AIAELIGASDCDLVIGSSLDRPSAQRLGVPFLAVSFPTSDRLVIDRGYAGYAGAVALIEDLGTALLSHSAC
ncbi:nitrogenase component 1, partial [Rhodoplanes sp. SY1]|uniref:nitrogenase component 1 n=1 Tax=Rhodoplanes sp. SY1 TaxID=3166646 RepID=UPI0038B4CDBD